MTDTNSLVLIILTSRLLKIISRPVVWTMFEVTTRAKTSDLINVVNNLLQCCAAPCQQCCAAHCQKLLSTTIVHSCSRSTIIVQSLLTTINKLVSSTIVGSCSNNIVTIIVLCQHRTTIDRTILINIVNSTSVVEP